MEVKKKILIIDDEEGFSHLVKISLEAAGKYEVKTEKEGRKGLATARSFRPDIIFLDVVIPDMTGGSVAAELGANPVTKDIPIVFLTAVVSEKEVSSQKGFIGGHPFLAKPVTTDKLIACIEENAGG